MADVALDGAELKKMLGVTRRQPLAFAYCPGKSADTDVFALHRKKQPDVLGRDLRKEGDGNKVALGMAALDGKVLSLTCERELPGMAKKLKKLLKVQKLPLNVVVMDANGNILEEDIEDLPDDDALADVAQEEAAAPQPDSTAQAPAEAESTEAPDTSGVKALMQRAAQIKAGIGAAPAPAQAKLTEPFKRAIAALQASQLEDADTILTKLEAALNALSGGASAPEQGQDAPEIEVLKKVSATLKDKIAALPSAEMQTKVAPVMVRLDSEIDAQDVSGAKKTAAALGTALAKVAAAAPAAAETGSAAKAFEAWTATLVSAQETLAGLHTALTQVGSEDVTRIANAALGATALGNPSALNSAIGAYNAASPETRAEAANTVLNEARDFRAALSNNPVIEMCEANPFGVTIDLKSRLDAALVQITAGVAA